MLKMSGFDVFFAAAGNLYLLLAVIGIGIALWKGKTWARKLIYTALVLAFSIAPIAPEIYRTVEYRNKLSKAEALFEERCKTAGEKIYKTVENVEGILVIKARTEEINFNQQFKLDDPYGYAGTGDGYLRLFIRGRSTVPTKIGEAVPSNKIVSYRFVEVADESGSGFYRYTTSMNKDESERITRNGGGVVPLLKEATPSRSARYGITWNDISTKEDRQSWIAGSSQKIIDLQTNEVIAERIGYMFDRGLGDTSGGRSPWAFARTNACPPLNEKTFYFFDRVIKPVQDATK